MICEHSFNVSNFNIYSILVLNIWFFVLLWIYLTVKIFNNFSNLNNLKKNNVSDLKNIIVDSIMV
jgi:hypothetical protein